MLVGQPLARIETGAAVGALNDDIRFVPGGGFENRIHAIGTDNIDGGQGIPALLAGIDQGKIVITCDNSRG